MRQSLLRVLLLTVLSMQFAAANAAPREVIIVRHADKLSQQDHGPTLSPTGYERAVHLAFYFMKTYGAPDYLIAANPNDVASHVASIRELQTLAPLANRLAQQLPEVSYTILDPYTVPEYPKLAQYLLADPRFNGKLVVVCWDHHTIPSLVNRLGVAAPQPVWLGADFDSVYVLKFAANGSVQSYQLLHKQYPVKAIKNWNHFLS